MRSRRQPADLRVRATLRSWLERPRYEVLPVAGVVEEIATELATPLTVTVTASPARGLGATLDVAEQIAALGHRTVPHLPARQLRDEVELKEIVDRLARAGIGDVFVVAGDASTQVGSFDGAVGVLAALARLGADLRVGVAGYPESHPRIPDDVTVQAMWDKRHQASYIVSQVCFDPVVVHRWLVRLRMRGIGLPVLLGAPGPVPTVRLLRIAQRIGVGESLRFLTRHAGMTRVAGPGAYDPLPLLTEVARTPAPGGGDGPEAATASGVHLYTFNAVAATEAWRRRLLVELEEGTL